FAGAGTSSWWRCSIRRRYPWGALSQSPGRPSRRWRHTLRSCRPQKGRWPPKTSGGRSDRAMREGTNMGIMTTLKKPTAERHEGDGRGLNFPRNKNAALPVRAQKDPLDHQQPQKIGPGWHLQPRAFAPQASVMASGVRDDVGHKYTCFMRRGEDARLHGRFLYLRRASRIAPGDIGSRSMRTPTA